MMYPMKIYEQRPIKHDTSAALIVVLGLREFLHAHHYHYSANTKQASDAN